MKTPRTRVIKNTKFHLINELEIECSGQDCAICKKDFEESFITWQNTVPFPFPPKGKRYRNSNRQRNRGKTILEICYTCKQIPCWICKRVKCKKWMKEQHLKGQEQGCSSWENGRCSTFACEKGLVLSHWREEIAKRDKR